MQLGSVWKAVVIFICVHVVTTTTWRGGGIGRSRGGGRRRRGVSGGRRLRQRVCRRGARQVGRRTRDSTAEIRDLIWCTTPKTLANCPFLSLSQCASQVKADKPPPCMCLVPIVMSIVMVDGKSTGVACGSLITTGKRGNTPGAAPNQTPIVRHKTKCRPDHADTVKLRKHNVGAAKAAFKAANVAVGVKARSGHSQTRPWTAIPPAGAMPKILRFKRLCRPA